MLTWFSLGSRIWTLMIYPVKTYPHNKICSLKKKKWLRTFIWGVFEPYPRMKIIHSLLCTSQNHIELLWSAPAVVSEMGLQCLLTDELEGMIAMVPEGRIPVMVWFEFLFSLPCLVLLVWPTLVAWFPNVSLYWSSWTHWGTKRK